MGVMRDRDRNRDGIVVISDSSGGSTSKRPVPKRKPPKKMTRDWGPVSDGDMKRAGASPHHF